MKVLWSKWRIGVLMLLMTAPLLFLAAIGAWYLWQHPDVGFVVWFPLMACFTLAYLLAWWWQRKAQLLPAPEVTPPLYWTERDVAAWQLVEARGKAVKDLDPDSLLSVQVYVDTAQAMARELAQFYHPKSKDPVGSLTIPEILAVVELASHDLAIMVDQYLPAGNLLTVDHWRKAPQVQQWYNWGSMAYWAVSAIFNPVQTVTRYVASQVGVSQPLRMLQENLVAWFYVAYVHRVGTYLIDVNSGRLKVGAKRYRELLGSLQPTPGATQRPIVATTNSPVEAQAAAAPMVTLTILGQVKAGKSSLINALLGEQAAGTDVLPLTNHVTRYELRPKSVDNQLAVLDTVGYAHEGPKADQLAATLKAVQDSDLVLLVMNARDPARKPDVETLQKLWAWYNERPQLRRPPFLGVLTHVDLLSPLMEWAPPYDFLRPQRPKEHSMAAAVAATKEMMGQYLIDVLPVCTAEGRVHGVQEWLLPRIVLLLGEARAVALLRCLRAEASAGKIRKVLDQLLQAGGVLLQVATEQKQEATGSARQEATGNRQ